LTYTWDNARGLVGIALTITVAWVMSEHRRRVPLVLIIGAFAVQVGLVLALFAIPRSHTVLAGVTSAVDGLAAATDRGTQFVFGHLGGGDAPYATRVPDAGPPFIFAFRVLPLILVISALSALLWHWKILEWITRGFGILFERTLGIGGAPALASAANVFMGMVESSIVIRAYLSQLTRADLFLVMVVGLATAAGSTMVAYAVLLAPVLPNAAGHVLAASIISAPAGILLARIMVPGDRGAGAGERYVPDLRYDGAMDALGCGIRDGVMMAVYVAAYLIVVVAFVWIFNGVLALAPPVAGAPLTLQRVAGWMLAPIAYVIGVPWREAFTAGSILGTKLFLTEFIAFIELGALPADQISERTRMIMTYAVCGFANVASVGIMTGGMVVLMPERRREIPALAWKALLPGFMATLMTAAVVASLPPGVFAGR
jgi:concentrative nucleoside transporter, CNT family